MRKNFLTGTMASFLTGSFLVVAAGSIQAADQYPQGGATQYPQGSTQYPDGSRADPSMGTNNRDMYDTRDPTAAGAQGPMRNDMDRNRSTYGMPSRYDSRSSYDTSSMYGSSAASQWDDLRRRLGPIGGEGTP